jgi:Flp pilus assembly protein TadD
MDESRNRAIVTAVQRGDFARAADTCNAHLAATGSLEAHHLFAGALLRHGHAPLALQYFAVLREAAPEDATVAFDCGCALHALGRLPEAIAAWRDALRVAPSHADACRNLAMGLLDNGEDDEAALVLLRLLRLAPQSADISLHLGNIRWRKGDAAGALDLYRHTLAMGPDQAAAWVNAGEALAALDRTEAAEAALRRGVAAAPGSQQAHFNLATFLLKEEKWQEGFAEFRWRANLAKTPPAIAGLPIWEGGDPAGRIGLWNDQGLGDGIQFLRFVPMLARRGWQPVLLLPRQLLRLAASLDGRVEAHLVDGPLPPLDCRAALADLPYLLGQCQPRTWWNGPYLAAQPAPFGNAGVPPAYRDEQNLLSAGLDAGEDARVPRRVGLVWRGNAGNKLGLNRQLPLAALSPLLALPHIDWFSLQVGPAVTELAASPWADRIADLSSRLSDFAETASVACSLDLIISVDTSVAHLAGALGRPLWVMLPERCDWRWMGRGETTPWYPTVRLFRRQPGRSWEELAETMAVALAGLCQAGMTV